MSSHHLILRRLQANPSWKPKLVLRHLAWQWRFHTLSRHTSRYKISSLLPSYIFTFRNQECYSVKKEEAEFRIKTRTMFLFIQPTGKGDKVALFIYFKFRLAMAAPEGSWGSLQAWLSSHCSLVTWLLTHWMLTWGRDTDSPRTMVLTS